MKKLSIFFLAVIALINLSACSEDDDFTFVAKPDPEGIAFTNTFMESYTLQPMNADNLAERFVWNEVKMDAPTTVRYELEGSTTETFETPTVFASDIAETNYAVTIGDLLDLATEAGLDNDPGTEDAPNTGVLYFRVRAYVGESAPSSVEQLSEVVGLTVVLPETLVGEPAKLQLYMVGNASPDGWNNNGNNTPLFRDPQNDNIFYYTGYFEANEEAANDEEKFAFKFLTTLGQWAPMYGPTETSSATSGALMFRETEDDPDTGVIRVESDGYYSLVVNLEDMTYTFEPYDASAATAYTTIGVLGDATPDAWDADQDMTPLPTDPHIWYINDMEFTDGEAKFRADDAWDISWGADTALSGEATLGGPNIPVTAGLYDVWFNDLTGRYIFIPQPQE